MNILIRCDGSKEEGLGHIFKYLAFADKLKAVYDCSITFAMRKSEPSIKLAKEKFPVLSPHNDNEKFENDRWLYDLVKFVNPDVLILDKREKGTASVCKEIKKIKKIKILVANIYEQEEKEEFINIAGIK